MVQGNDEIVIIDSWDASR